LFEPVLSRAAQQHAAQQDRQFAPSKVWGAWSAHVRPGQAVEDVAAVAVEQLMSDVHSGGATEGEHCGRARNLNSSAHEK
jgi:hypothetical protein